MKRGSIALLAIGGVGIGVRRLGGGDLHAPAEDVARDRVVTPVNDVITFTAARTCSP